MLCISIAATEAVIMKDYVLIVIVGILSLVVLTLGYWYLIRSDGTVLLSVSSIIGGAIGWVLRSKFPIRQGTEAEQGYLNTNITAGTSPAEISKIATLVMNAEHDKNGQQFKNDQASAAGYRKKNVNKIKKR